MTVFELGEFSRNLLFLFGMGIMATLNMIGGNELSMEYPSKGIKFKKHPFISVWVMFMAEASIIIFYFIERQKTKNKRAPTQRTVVLDTYEVKETISPDVHIEVLPGENKIQTLLIIFMCLVLDLIATTTLVFFRENASFIELIIKLITIFVSTILSQWLLKYKYHKHHAFGILLVSIGLIIYTIIDFMMNGMKDVSIPLALLSLALYCLSAFQEVSEKYLMDTKYVSPYVVVSFEGLGGVVVMIIVFLVLNQFPCDPDSLICDYDSTSNHSVENFFESISYIFSHYEYYFPFIKLYFSMLFFNIFRLKSNEHYSPTHRSIADCFGALLKWILTFALPFLKPGNVTPLSIVGTSIAYVIMMIGLVIYLEIIVLKVFGLERNTRYHIIQREEHFNLTEELYKPDEKK